MAAAWALPNRKRFVTDMDERLRYDTGVYSRGSATAGCNKAADAAMTLFEHQRIVARFLAEDTPYRGLLLYHGLGAGKTCAAINAAAAAQHGGRRRVVVLLPASLEASFAAEVPKCGRGKQEDVRWRFEPLHGKVAIEAAAARYGLSAALIKKHGGVWETAGEGGGVTVAEMDEATREQLAAQLRAEITFFHYNGLTRAHMGTLTRILEHEPCIVIIDEVHNFISRAINNPASLSHRLHSLLCSSSHCKIIAMSGTPFVNHPREIAFLVNLVRGFERLYELKINVGQAKDATQVVADLNGLGLVDHVERLDVERGRIRLKMAPDGFRREPGTDLYSRDEASVPEAGLEEAMAVLARHGITVIGDPAEVEVPLMPQDVEGFFETFIDEVSLGIKNKDVFTRRLLGFVSYFGYRNAELFPSIKSDEVVRCEMHEHQARRYLEVRTHEIKLEEATAKRRAVLNALDAPGQVYKTFSRMACNFVFPEGIRRPYPSTMQDDDDGAEEDTTYEAAISRAIAAVVKDSERYLGRDLASLSTKFAALIQRVEESPGTVLVYSQFRKVEGVTMLAEALRARGYTELRVQGSYLDGGFDDPKRPRFIVYDGNTHALLDVFNTNFAALPPSMLKQLKDAYGPNVSNVRGQVARVLMVTQSGAEGISLRNVRQVHIVEPYWNNIRLDQVIGRAVRTCSHAALSREERNVSVYRYVATLPRELADPSSRVMLQDGWKSADELVMEVAERKTRVMREILDMMRAAAVDCAAHRTLHEGVECYSFGGKREGLAYNIDIVDDELNNQAAAAPPGGGGDLAQVVEIQHKQYVLMIKSNDLYDYKAYKRGVLKYVGRLVPTTQDGKKGFYIKEP